MRESQNGSVANVSTRRATDGNRHPLPTSSGVAPHAPGSADPASTALGADFFEMGPDLQCVVGADGYFKLLNRAWGRVFGWTNEELMARPWVWFVHPDDRRAMLDAARADAGELGTTSFRTRYCHRDGFYRWLDWSAAGPSSSGLIYASARVTSRMDLLDDAPHSKLRRQRIEALLSRDVVGLAWQPIVTLPGHSVRGYEALARFRGRPRRAPNLWFDDAEHIGLRTQLELLVIRQALSYARQIPEGVFLSLNASPATLLADELATLTASLGPRIVMEVTEHAAVQDYDSLTVAISALRSLGVRLAIDDAGAGFASMAHVVRLSPDFIKLDASLIHNVDVDRTKRALAAALVRFARETGADLIGEGIETRSQLHTVETIGVDLGQGFLLGRPAALAPRVPPAD